MILRSLREYKMLVQERRIGPLVYSSTRPPWRRSERSAHENLLIFSARRASLSVGFVFSLIPAAKRSDSSTSTKRCGPAKQVFCTCAAAVSGVFAIEGRNGISRKSTTIGGIIKRKNKRRITRRIRPAHSTGSAHGTRRRRSRTSCRRCRRQACSPWCTALQGPSSRTRWHREQPLCHRSRAQR